MELFASQDPRSYSLYFDLNIWLRARKVTRTFEKRTPGAKKTLGWAGRFYHVNTVRTSFWNETHSEMKVITVSFETDAWGVLEIAYCESGPTFF